MHGTEKAKHESIESHDAFLYHDNDNDNDNDNDSDAMKLGGESNVMTNPSAKRYSRKSVSELQQLLKQKQMANISTFLKHINQAMMQMDQRGGGDLGAVSSNGNNNNNNNNNKNNKNKNNKMNRGGGQRDAREHGTRHEERGDGTQLSVWTFGAAAAAAAAATTTATTTTTTTTTAAATTTTT
ncbi:hypothetical protein RFI_22831, partial [Reticulomyxa filosa]